MTIQINHIEDTALVAVTVNDQCNHAGGTHQEEIERYAGRFDETFENYYPDFYYVPVDVCNKCNMYFDQEMGYWEVK